MIRAALLALAIACRAAAGEHVELRSCLPPQIAPETCARLPDLPACWCANYGCAESDPPVPSCEEVSAAQEEEPREVAAAE